MGFSRQEYWRGLPFPSPGGLPDPGVKPVSPRWQAEESLQQEGVEAHDPELGALGREAEPGTGRPEHRQQAEPAAEELTHWKTL